MVMYLHMGFLYLNPDMRPDYDAAKSAFHKAIAITTTASGWLGYGVACLKLNDLSSAEDAFAV